MTVVTLLFYSLTFLVFTDEPVNSSAEIEVDVQALSHRKTKSDLFIFSVRCRTTPVPPCATDSWHTLSSKLDKS